MARIATTNIYLAIRERADRSHIEDELVLDGADVSSFASARDVWKQFQVRRARFVITEQNFGDDFDGFELVRSIRKNYPIPHVHVLMGSVKARVNDITEGLRLGVDDYLVLPRNPFQFRSRVLVGMKWITYIDSVNRGFQHQHERCSLAAGRF
jgi:DNA-binding response OmpR family regulator